MEAARILVPVDGSEAAEAAVPVALELARSLRANLILLRVTDVRFEQEPSPVDTGLAPIREAESYLKILLGRIDAGGVAVAAFVWRGSPAAAIVRAARHYRVNFIVMTTHGRTWREREMFGSVAEAVLRGVTVPILVVRPAGVVVQTPPGDAAPWPGP
jgi:nucleotide-binding universal stress UspA family protein